MRLYAVEFSGYIGIIKARDKEHAGAIMQRRQGTDNGPYFAHEATEEDKTCVKAMGGYIPKLTEKEEAHDTKDKM